ncbi:MAG: DUF4126 domain-containing protein [Candidatus Polarisedimenticolia bacterium]|nr:DUF4126 domain-containing protein [bacterium]
MDGVSWPMLAAEVAAGIALAACCGLRAFLPPLVVGLAARFHLSEMLLGRPLLSPSFEWLASTPVLVVLSVAVLFELAADKIPALDHALDVVQTIVRPLAGALAFAASLGGVPPWAAAAAGLVVGAPLAGVLHLGKAKIRLLSTFGTGGLASPFISFFEDIVTIVGAVLAVLAGFAALILVLVGAYLTYRLVRVFLRRVGRLRADLGAP